MKLAVFGNEGKTTRAVISHGKKQGYQIIAPNKISLGTGNIAFEVSDAVLKNTIKKADAVLCILHEGHKLLDESSHKVVKRLVDAMIAGSSRRLVLFSFMSEDHAKQMFMQRKSFTSQVKALFKHEVHQAKSAFDVLKSSGLDWTVLGWPQDGSMPKNLGKHMINQLTDVSNLQRVYMLPGSSEGPAN